MASESPAIGPEDRELLERIAARVVELHMEIPALLALETALPVSTVAGQALLFFEPFAAAWLRLADYRRFSSLAGRREALAELATLIETRAEAARAKPPRPH